MSIMNAAIVLTGLTPYLLLVFGIVRGTIRQSFATWILWLALDSIVLRGIIEQHGNPTLYVVFTFGTLMVATVLLATRQFSWGSFESFVSVLVVGSIVVYLTSSPYDATIATVAALFIAGIPQIRDTYRDPRSTSTIAYLLFTISSTLALLENNRWTVPEKLPQIDSVLFCSIVTLLSLRKPNPSTP